MSDTNLRVIKLVTGDEIIGSVRDGAAESSDDESYTLDNLVFVSNPMRIISEYDAKSKVHALYLADWVPAISDSTLPIDKQKILTLGTPNKELEAHYIDLLLAQSLLESLYPKEGDVEASSNQQEESTDPPNVLDKLKKHKFDDDDIQ